MSSAARAACSRPAAVRLVRIVEEAPATPIVELDVTSRLVSQLEMKGILFVEDMFAKDPEILPVSPVIAKRLCDAARKLKVKPTQAWVIWSRTKIPKRVRAAA